MDPPIMELEALLLVLQDRVAASHVGHLHDAANVAPAHPDLVWPGLVHVAQVVDQPDLVEGHVLVLLFYFDRPC